MQCCHFRFLTELVGVSIHIDEFLDDLVTVFDSLLFLTDHVIPSERDDDKRSEPPLVLAIDKSLRQTQSDSLIDYERTNLNVTILCPKV